jgi:hypothetical protein
MTDFNERPTEIDWSPRAIINVAGVPATRGRVVTLVGAHAVEIDRDFGQWRDVLPI